MASKYAQESKPVQKIIRRLSGPLFIPRPKKTEGVSFYGSIVPFVGFFETIKTPPGSGKTRDATEFVNRAWEEGGRKGLYLMLSHEAIEERLEKLKEHGEDKHWTHWRPHAKHCERRKANEAGYLGQRSCNCGRGELKANGPTLAPLDFVLPSLPDQNQPLLNIVSEFDFWVIDEIDFRRLLGYTCAKQADVEGIAQLHPNEGVRVLCTVISTIMRELEGERLNGRALYEVLEGHLADKGTSLSELVAGPTLDNLLWYPTSFKGVEQLPKNFPPTLVPVLKEEVSLWEQGKEFNPRVHIVKTGEKAKLRVWWRKELIEDDQIEINENGGWLQPSFLILDATANINLLVDVFGHSSVKVVDAKEWPDNVFVHQWVDNLVSRQTLGIRHDTGTFSDRSKEDRQRWYGRIAEELKTFSRETPIGIITHKAIEEDTEEGEGEVKRALKELGFKDVRSRHYGGERGSNELEDVHVLILLGLPIPNSDGFKEEAQAFLYDSKRLEFKWGVKSQYLEMTDGEKVEVQVGGYWEWPEAAYYWQKCQAGLYQALHRIRPYNEQEYDRHVFIYTNMPIDGVKVTGLLRTETKQRTSTRRDLAIEILSEQLDMQKEVTASHLIKLVKAGSPDKAGVTRWIQRNAPKLAEETASNYTAMRGRPGGRFMRQ